MELKLVQLFCIFNCVLFTKAQNDINYVCNMSVSYTSDLATSEKIQNIREYCKDLDKPCVPKCCGRDEVLFSRLEKKPKTNKTIKGWPKCTSLKTLGLDKVDYTTLGIYNKSLESGIVITEKKFFEDFHVVQNKIFEDRKCVDRWTIATPYILEDGMFASDLRSIGATWFKKEPKYYCVDLAYDIKKKITKVTFFVAEETGDEEKELVFVGIASVISSIFLVPVLLVYGVLPQLRNLSGMLLMAYVSTLLLTFISKAILIFFASYMKCAFITSLFYFFFLSTFFWLNIMSFDIWWTFRGQRLKRAIHRRGVLVKFGWYCLYGWGTPLAMTIMAVIIDSIRDQLPSNIQKPMFDTCLNSDESVRYYLHLPLGLLTMINVALFMMTVYNIWLIKRRLNEFSGNSSSTRKNENRFGLYVKMSMLMGVSWLLELLAVMYPKMPFEVYLLINFYNALIGVVIFILFVLNKKTLRMLCKRYNIKCGFLEDKKFDPNTSRSTTKSSANRGSYNRPTDHSDVEMSDVTNNEVSSHPNPK